ncbi:MAG: hypothetical protein AAB966_01515 [Patescibacteria group bacterium]
MNKKEFLLITVCVFISIIIWMVSDIYHKSAEEKIKTTIKVPEIKNYQIDTDILEILERKQE